MANKYRAEMSVEIGGKKRKARMSLGAMAAIETETGSTIPRMINQMVEMDLPGAGLSACIIHHALAAADKTVSREQVEGWMDDKPLIEWSTAAVSLLSLGMTGGAEGNAEAPSE